jgi:putative solute:sodium symporter small subunit
MSSEAQVDKGAAYWKANLKLLILCMVIWTVVSYGLSIVFVAQMNTVMLGGYPLGFWFAQQGSIYIYLALIFFYAWQMNRIDRKFDMHEV